ncbi:heme-dependent catalase [Tothia fuscella]|uniref:Heme-dependent catalase n=1 Tax=Tothia fuscella TaxID=1048955 RepID=A0A9P4NJ65_9PEZI|nr:heme-dependent catalase [Tothia fuscella]
MPMPTDEKLVASAEEVLGLFKDIFGDYPGYRPAHAKGIIVNGTFKPTPEATALSKAAIFTAASTPVTARFSNSTGIPNIPDNDLNASPRGFGIRFNLPDKNGRRVHTDIVSHSTPFFPASTGKEFGEFLQALLAGKAPEFLGAHPETMEFVGAPKPFPVSFATEGFFALNAFKFIAADGKETWVRYIWVPTAGKDYLSEEEAKAKGPDYLGEELTERIGKGPIGFKFLAQIGEAGDVTDNIQSYWPAERTQVELGTVTLDALEPDTFAKQKVLAFDPIPRIDGIEPSDDPILEFRAALYLTSVRQRRAA